MHCRCIAALTIVPTLLRLSLTQSDHSKKYAKLRKEAEEIYGKPADDDDEEEINVATSTTATPTGTVAAAIKSNINGKTSPPKAVHGKRKTRGKAAAAAPAVVKQVNDNDDEADMSEEIVVATKKIRTKSGKGKAKA